MSIMPRLAGKVWLSALILALACCHPSGDDNGTPDPGNEPDNGNTDNGNTDGGGTDETGGYEPYDIGAPVLADLWIDPLNGDDGNTGASRDQALRTLLAAWNGLPDTTTTTGYRINITAGELAFDEAHGNFYAGKHGTRDYPLVIRAADGAGTTTILGGLNVAAVSYLYLLDVRLYAGGETTWGNNILHLDGCDHVLVRGVTIEGPVPDVGTQINESFKANQSQYIYLEDSEVHGGWLTGVDWVSVQHGHMLGNRIHGFESDWGTYFKGGTSYIVVAGNEYYDCHLGFSAGQTTNMEIMRSPWVQYECYDIKFVNNLLHDIRGNGMGVQGGYNILLAYNTLYNVGANPTGYGMLLIARGGRVCYDTSENGADNADTLCNPLIDAGGWCPPPTSPTGGPAIDDAIPNRNVFVYNNVFCNPAGVHTLYATLDIHGPLTPPVDSRTPSPALADDNLRIRGNVFWDGSADHLGVTGDEGTACANANPTCNPAQLAADNAVGTIDPALIDAVHDLYQPVAGGNLFSADVFEIPDFAWSDLPASPEVPQGLLSNQVAQTIEGHPRTPNRLGAY